jgi:hypothetical protein
MRTDIRVGAYVMVDDHCPIEFSIDGDGDVELLMGDRCDGFEMIYTPTALQRFLTLGAQALEKASQQLAEAEAAEQTQPS